MSNERKSIFGRLLRPKPATEPTSSPPAPARARPSAPATSLQLDRSLLDAEVDDNWTACIDFGTAFSKIVMVRRHEAGATTTEHVRPLQIGPAATPGFSPLMCPSVLYILQERIHFGERAFIVHANHGADNRRRFESPKHYISALNQQLLETPASEAEDPTQRFTRALHRIVPEFLFDKGVPHTLSLAKYAAAFFRIAFSIFNRDSSARSLETSCCSGLTARLMSPALNFPAA